MDQAVDRMAFLKWNILFQFETNVHAPPFIFLFLDANEKGNFGQYKMKNL